MKVRSHKDQPHAKAFIGWRVVILMAALIGLSLLIWEGAWLSGNEKITSGYLGKPKMGSTKFHVDRDNPNRKNRHSKEPVAAFFERARRGMTKQEIRGMIADFEAIGPMPHIFDLEARREYVAKQNDWYLAALSEGLGLTADQRRAARESLNQDLVQKIDLIRSASHGYDRHAVTGPLKHMDLSERLHLGSLSPWSLCDLTENQLKLTYKKFLQMKAEEQNNNLSPLNPGLLRHSFRSLAMHDVVTGDIVVYPPPSNYDLRCTLHGTLSGGIIDISETFPLTPDQKLADHRGDLVAQVIMLHPSQFRTALLKYPHLAQTIKNELDKPRE